MRHAIDPGDVSNREHFDHRQQQFRWQTYEGDSCWYLIWARDGGLKAVLVSDAGDRKGGDHSDDFGTPGSLSEQFRLKLSELSRAL